MKKWTNVFKELMQGYNLFISFCKDNKVLISFLGLIAILSYGFELTNYSLSIDNEWALRDSSRPSFWFTQSRFGVGLLKGIFKNIYFLPFWSNFLSILFLFLSCIVWCVFINEFLIKKKELGEKTRKIILFIFGGLIISFPTNATYMSFSVHTMEISIGILLCVLSVISAYKWVFQSKSNIYFFISLATLTYSLGIYQSFVCYFLTGLSSIVLIDLLTNNSKNKIKFKNFFVDLLKILSIIVSSVIAYELISHIFYIKYPYYGYLENYFYWKHFNVNVVVSNFFNFYNTQVFSNTRLFFYKLFFFTTLFSLFVVIYEVIFKQKNKISFFFWYVVLILSPFSLSFILGMPTLMRMMQSVALLMGVLWVIILLVVKNKYFKSVLVVTAILFIIYQTQQISLLFFSDYLRYQQDIVKAANIANKISDLGYGESPNYPVVFIGANRRPKTPMNIKMETIGFSFTEWDSGNTDRISAFMESVGYKYIRPNLSEIDMAHNFQKEMTIWPDKNSVVKKENIIIVKFSD